MLHIFVDPAAMQGDALEITGEEVGHIRNVLRMKPGEEISVSNGEDSRDYRYVIREIREDSVLLSLRTILDEDTELPVRPYLFQGLPKGEKMDAIVQKAVELGVYEIIPVSMHRCVMKLDAKKAEKKTERWQKIAEAAAMQSRRRIVPKVQMPMTMKEALAYAEKNAAVRVLPYELQEDDGSTKALMNHLADLAAEGEKPGTAVFIGPEGGFEKDEVELARQYGVRPISLGRRILRTETAGLTFLAWLIYILEIS